MASFSVVVKPSAQKELHALPPAVLRRICIGNLAHDPFPRGSMKLAGAEQLRRLRIGDYRVIFAVQLQAKLVTVHYVRHRRDAYRSLY